MSKYSQGKWWNKRKHHGRRSAHRNRVLRASKTHLVEQLEDRIVMSADPIYVTNDASNTQKLWDQLMNEAFSYASNLGNYTSEQLEGAERWVVKTDSSISSQNFFSKTGMVLVNSSAALSNTFYAYAGSLSSSAITNLLSNNSAVQYFYPSVEYDVTTMALTNDPLVGHQWHLQNTGQELSNPNETNYYAVWGNDVGAAEAWKVSTGEGVRVAVVDTGVQGTHPDLNDNFDPNYSFNFNQNSQNPTIDTNADFHGTAVGGIIAAEGNNGTGVAGIAYNATLSDFRFLGTDQLNVTIDEEDYYGLFTKFNDVLDIYNHSWGEGNPARTVSPANPGIVQGIIDSVFTGGDGLGAIHIIASGNSAGSGDTGANTGLANSPYVIAVSGYGPTGTAVTYAEAGPAIFVTGPTGQNPPTSGIYTTDLTGDLGYNNSQGGVFADGDWLEDTNYTSQFNGTSAATPAVSGVVALMVDAARANGVELSLRDVQHILARSAYQIDATDTGGFDTGGWQTNARPLFYDPLEVDGVPVGAQDPNYPGQDAGMFLVSGVAPTTDRQFALPNNGAGYTVHDGINGVSGGSISTGYGHGAIDARMAVEIASTWQSVGKQEDVQILSGSFTSGNIPAAETVDVGGREITIPGGVGGQAGFEEYFDLWLNPPGPDDDLPDPLPVNTRGDQSITIAVPAHYSVEWIQVSLQMEIDAAASEQLRFTLISPDGVQSELTNWERTQVNGPLAADGALDFTFSTNRHWGELTEGVGRIDPLTGERIEPEGFQGANGETTLGTWQLVIENWSDEATSVSGDIFFHATPTPVINYLGGTQLGGRIQGTIGLDINQDDTYNFTGVIATEEEVMGGMDAPPETVITSSIDLAYEPKVSGVKVYIDFDEDGELDPEEPFTYTTADGNYYFDMVWNTNTDPEAANYDYQVRFILPEGYDVVGDDMHEYRMGVQEDGTIAAYHIDSNFILQPQAITMQGNVYADFDLDDTYDSKESSVAGLRVFVDLNENGVLDYIDYNGNNQFENGIDDALEPVAVTGSDGAYLIEITTDFNVPVDDIFGNTLFLNDLYIGAGYYSLMLDAQDGWTPTSEDVTAQGFAGTFAGKQSPSLAFKRLYATPGDVFTDLNFGVAPGEEGNTTLSGYVFKDANQNGVRDGAELGIPGATVYLDLDRNGELSGLDLSVITGANGSYLFDHLAAGTYDIRVVPPSSYTSEDVTFPAFGYHPNVTLAENQSKGGGFLDFGFLGTSDVQPLAIDYGDLPAPYATTSADGGASHGIIDIYHLGASVTADTDGQPDANGDADSNDDGVEFVSPILAGSTVSLNVTASTNVLFLQAWVDFNNDGDFNDEGEHLTLHNTSGISSKQLRLDAGVNELTFTAPSEVSSDALAARFRYGEGGFAQFNKPNGAALVGEVEDYIVSANPSTSFIEPIAGDYDGSGIVDRGDYLYWKGSFGTTNLNADGNGDGKVNLADYTVWRNNLGAVAPVVVSPLAAFVTSDAEGSSELDPGLPSAMSTSGLSGIGMFVTSTEDSEESQAIGSTNDAVATGVLDLAFDLAEEEEEGYDSDFALSEDTTSAALAVALEDDFGDLL